MKRARQSFWIRNCAIAVALAVSLPVCWDVGRRARAAVLFSYSTSRPTLDWGLSPADVRQWRSFALAHLKGYSACFTGTPVEFAMRRDLLRFDDVVFHFAPGAWKLNHGSKGILSCRPISSNAFFPLFQSDRLELVPTTGEIDLAIIPNIRGCPYDTVQWWPPKPKGGSLNTYLLDGRGGVTTALLLVDPNTREAWLFAHNLD